MVIEWDSSRHALLAGDMDDAHQHSVELIRALAMATDATELACLDRLRVHCDEHFLQEESWITDAKLPMADKHRRDHMAIRTVILDARAELIAGHTGAGRRLSTELFRWFDRHFSTYDAALAFCMQRTRHAEVGIPAVG